MFLCAYADPPLPNSTNDSGRVPVNANATQEAVEQSEDNDTEQGLSKVRRTSIRSPLAPAKLVSVLPVISEEIVGTRPVIELLRAPIVLYKPVCPGIRLRSASNSLIQAKKPCSRFSSSTVEGGHSVDTSNKWFKKSVKVFLKRVSHTLSGKKEKNDTLLVASELISERVQSVVVQESIDEDAVYHGYEIIVGACDEDTDLDLTSIHHGGTSGNVPKKEAQYNVNASGPIDDFGPSKCTRYCATHVMYPTTLTVSQNSLDCLPTTCYKSPRVTRDSVFSTTTSSSSCSDIKVPTYAELQEMADALSEINRLATHRDWTRRRRTNHNGSVVATPESESPSSSHLDVCLASHMEVKIQGGDPSLRTEITSIKPTPFRGPQSTSHIPADQLSAAADKDHVPNPNSQSCLKHNTRLQAPRADVATQEVAIDDQDTASTSSLGLEVPSDSQLQLLESILCSSDKSLSFSDSGIGLMAPCSTETKDADSISSSPSDFAVPTDSQMQLMEDLLCGKSSVNPAPPPSQDNHHKLEDSCCGLNTDTEQGFLDSGTHLFSSQGFELESNTSSEIIVPTTADIYAVEVGLMPCYQDSSSSIKDESSSQPGSPTELANSPPSFGFIEWDMLSSAGRAATARRFTNRRNARQSDMQPKRSALHREPDIVEVDRVTGLPVKSDWREVHFPEKDLIQVAIIPREPATVDMSYIVPDPDPVQMTADKVFLNTACLMPRTDVPRMRLDRVFPIVNITSPRPFQNPPAPYRSTPTDRKGTLCPVSKAESPPEDEPRRSPWANHNRFFDYDARVKSDPYTLGEHKELVLWRNRHRFGRRTSLYLPGVPFIIRDSKNVLRRASNALEDHICRLGLNEPRKLPIQTPVRSVMTHNAHFLRHAEAEECPCGKSRKLRRLDGLFKPTNVSVYAITEVSQYAENGLIEPETDSALDSSDPDTDKPSAVLKVSHANRVADSLFACGAYRARQLAHPLVTEYSHLYDLHPRRIYTSFIPTPGSFSVSHFGSVPASHFNHAPPPFDLSRPEHVVPQLMVTSAGSQSPAVSSYSLAPDLLATCSGELGERNASFHVSCSVDPMESLAGVCTQAGSRNPGSLPYATPSYDISVDARTDCPSASQKQGRDLSHHIIKLSSGVTQQSRPSGIFSVSSDFPACSSPSSLACCPDPSGRTNKLAFHASDWASNPADTLNLSSTTPKTSLSVPLLRAVTSWTLFLPKPSLDDLSHYRA